jgi:hypothetical protein
MAAPVATAAGVAVMPAPVVIVVVGVMTRGIVGSGEMAAQAAPVSMSHGFDIGHDISWFKIYLGLVAQRSRATRLYARNSPRLAR